MYAGCVALFKVITGGIDWGDLSKVLGATSLGEFMLIVYISFTVIAVMNVITGVFLDTATERAKKERELYLVRSAKRVFEQADHTSDGTITWEDFKPALEHSDVQAFFHTIDLEVSEAQSLFELLDTSSDGFISSDEFLKGCLRLRGPAKALDLLALSREVMLHFRRQEIISTKNRHAILQNKAYMEQREERRTENSMNAPPTTSGSNGTSSSQVELPEEVELPPSFSQINLPGMPPALHEEPSVPILPSVVGCRG
jgi:Ca2+-binding EF-hand superfamily protein